MTRFVAHTLLACLTATAILLGLTRVAAANPAPAAATGPTCTLLFGGGGTVTPDQDTNSRWFILNSAVSRYLASALTKLGYPVQEFITSVQDEDKRADALQEQLYKSGCSQVLRLTDELTADPAHPGHLSKFTFVVSVLRLDELRPPSKAYTRSVRIAEKYEMAYEYPMKPGVIEKMSFSDLAQSMAADVDKAHVLQK